MDCRAAGLTGVPSYLPPHTVHLDLSSKHVRPAPPHTAPCNYSAAQIREVDGLRDVSGLERLNLSHNWLESASCLAGAADAPHSWLDLRANRLTFLAELETLLGRARGRIYLGTKQLQWWPKMHTGKKCRQCCCTASKVGTRGGAGTAGRRWRAGRCWPVPIFIYIFISIYFFGV